MYSYYMSDKCLVDISPRGVVRRSQVSPKAIYLLSIRWHEIVRIAFTWKDQFQGIDVCKQTTRLLLIGLV